MEIQDRNIIVQQAVMQKLNLFQVTEAEGSAFADMLKTSAEKSIAEQPKNVENLQEIREKVSPVKVSNTETKLSKRTVENTEIEDVKEKDVKATQQKKAKDMPKAEKEKNVPEQKTSEEQSVKIVESASSQEPEVKEISEDKVVEEKVVAVEIIPVMEDIFEEKTPQNTVDFEVEEQAEVLVAAVPVALKEIADNEITDNKDIVFENQNSTVEIAQSEPEELSVKKVKHQSAEAVFEEMPEIATKEEVMLMEQARYLDEKVPLDKKLKIEVNVEEEKIAAPITKDVLKNRFEIDSMFQSVDTETQEFFEVSNVLKTDAPVQGVQKTLQPQPQINVDVVPIAEKGISIEHQGSTVAEITEAVVSGKEGFVETTNALRGEVFSKINEATSRDPIRGMSKEVVEQIKVNITKSAIKGVDTVEIQLRPEDLGKIQIKMHIAKDGRLQADIVASRAETLDILQKEASTLAEAFNDAGYNTDTKSFNFSFQRENQFANQQQEKTELSRFSGESIEQEAENFENDNFFYDPMLGLNIRV